MTNLAVLYIDPETDEEVELDVRIDYYLPPVKGVYSGAWEDSYPDEPAEVEYTVLDPRYVELEYDLWFMEIILGLLQERSYDD